MSVCVVAGDGVMADQICFRVTTTEQSSAAVQTLNQVRSPALSLVSQATPIFVMGVACETTLSPQCVILCDVVASDEIDLLLSSGED